MPRLAAFSLGMLMFTTNTIVSEGTVEGKKLEESFGKGHWESCRASAIDPDHAADIWFGRLLRRPSAVTEHGPDGSSNFKCFNTEMGASGTAKPAEFNLKDLQFFFSNQSGVDKKEALKMGVEVPYNGTASLLKSYGFPMTYIEPVLVGWGLVNEESFPQFTFHCIYQCVKWKTVGLMAVIKNVGSIVAGSAVVVKTSDSISQKMGGRWFGCFQLGLPLVTAETSPEELHSIIRSTRSRPGKGRSKTFAAMLCMGVALGPLRFASKLDNDGFFSVDYYVTSVFFSALLMACMIRQFNPYKMSMIAYTKNMWLDGKDSFVDPKHHTFRELDLYEWIHLSNIARAKHLFQYARIITPKDVEKELKRQKEIQKADVKDLHHSDEAKRKKAEADSNDRNKREAETPFDQYHNKGALLKVKTVKDVSVVTTSPPVVDEDLFDGEIIKQSTIVSKLVIVRPNAVGTVVEKVDDQRVKVRFPRSVPKGCPLQPRSVPHIVKKKNERQPVTKEMRGELVPVTVTWTDKDSCGKLENMKETDRQCLENAKVSIDEIDPEPMHQYSMLLTPNPSESAHRRKLNAWLHNSLLQMLKPKPHHSPEEDSQQAHNFERLKKDESNHLDAPLWEDVVVSLHEVIEVSAEWHKVEQEDEKWFEKVYKPKLGDDKSTGQEVADAA